MCTHFRLRTPPPLPCGWAGQIAPWHRKRRWNFLLKFSQNSLILSDLGPTPPPEEGAKISQPLRKKPANPTSLPLPHTLGTNLHRELWGGGMCRCSARDLLERPAWSTVSASATGHTSSITTKAVAATPPMREQFPRGGEGSMHCKK